MKLKTKWLKHCKTEKDKEALRLQLVAAKPVLELLVKILEEDADAVDRYLIKHDNYDLPSWSEYIADKLGEKRTYNKIIDLVTLED